MKNIYKIIFACLVIAFTGCEDAIDIEQPGRLSADNAFQDIGDLRSGLLGAYDFLDTTSEIGFTAAFTDEVFRGRDNGGQNQNELNNNINTGNGYVFSIWANNYGAIRLANDIIAAAASIDRSEDPVEYDNVLGQTYAIRAYAHFQILTYFSPDYVDDNALAGLLLTEPTSDIFAQVARSTNGEFYAQIESDLNTAEDLITSNEGNTFFNDDVITAMRARMAAYRGQYSLADNYAAELLASYPIADQNQYTAMFEDADETEVIFKLERTVNDSWDGQGTGGGGWAGSLFAFINAGDGGGPFMEMSRSVFNLLDGTADVRLSRNLNLAESTINPDYDTDDNFINSDVLLVFKYPGSESKDLMNDLKIFRSSEMLLIRAEAAADANDLNGAAGFIKQLRDARYGSSQSTPSYANQTEAFGDILDERRLELLFEGHRWVDLKRLGTRGNRTIDRDDKECSFLSLCTLPNSDDRFTMPIPLAEVTANSAIEQNPGY